MSTTRLFALLLLSLPIGTFAQAPADTATARALFRESVELTDQLQYRPAAERLWEATRILEEAGAAESGLYASVLHQRGIILIKTARPDSALLLTQKALELREKLFGYNSEPVARSLLNIGQAYYGKVNFKKALEYSLKSLEVAKTLPPGYEASVAAAYNNCSNAHVQMNNLQTALLYADSALQVRENTYPIDSINLAISYHNTGNLQVFAGNAPASVAYLEKSLAIRLVLLPSEHPDVATTYCNLGAAVHFTGDNERALLLLQTALDIRRKAPPADEIEMAESYANLMLPLIPLGNYDRAIEYGRQALAICQRLGLRGVAVKGIAHLAWGNALVYKDELDEALEQYRLALEVFNFTRNAPLAADVLNNISGVYGQKHDYANQKKYVRQALERKRPLQKDHPDLAIAYINMALACQNAGQPDSVLIFLDSAETHLMRTFGPAHPHFVTLHNVRAQALAQQGNRAAALHELDQAKRANRYERPGAFQRVTHLDNLLTTLAEVGSIWRDHTDAPQHLERAQAAFWEVYAAVEYLRATPSLEHGSQVALNNRVFPLYEALLSVQLALADQDQSEQYRREAYRLAESSKSFALLQAVRNSGAKRFSGLPQHLADQEKQLQASTQKLERQCRAAETTPSREGVIDSLFDLLVTQKDAYRTFLQSVKQQYPAYYALKYSTTVETVETTQTLLAPDQALLEYFVGDSSIYLFLIRPDTFMVHPVKRDFPLENWIEQFRQGLYGYHTAPEDQRTTALYERCLAQYLEFAPKLCEKLVTPLAAWLPENVILVPDGPLGYIPFDALLSAAPKDRNNFKAYPYLLRRHQFSYTYSAMLLREMRDKKHRREPEKPFCAFAPFYTGDTLVFERDYAFVSRRGFDPLPHTKDEVGRARREMGGDIVTGASATEQRFVETAGQYRILHLATHGVADNRLGDYAYLAFSEIPDSIENELLYVCDLYSLQLNADLVVLSACETGVGKLRRGEGIISLARAFAYAGAKSTVTSLWQVNSQSTAELMKLFYAELKTGKDKDKALRSARTAYIQQASVKNSHPFYWAAFVPVGDMRAVR